MSLIIRQIIPKTPPPKRDTLINIHKIFEEPNNHPSRIRPYPPNFNRIPARIIDPPTGASTWALGSHWWTKYIGNFTRKAITEKILKSGILLTNLILTIRKNIELDIPIWIIITIVNNNGREAKRV